MAMTTGQKPQQEEGAHPQFLGEESNISRSADIMKAPKEARHRGCWLSRRRTGTGWSRQYNFRVRFKSCRQSEFKTLKGFSRNRSLFSLRNCDEPLPISKWFGEIPLYMASNSFFPGPHWEETCKNLRAYAIFGMLDSRYPTKRPRIILGSTISGCCQTHVDGFGAEPQTRPHYNTLAELLNQPYGIVDLPLIEEASALRLSLEESY